MTENRQGPADVEVVPSLVQVPVDALLAGAELAELLARHDEAPRERH